MNISLFGKFSHFSKFLVYQLVLIFLSVSAVLCVSYSCLGSGRLKTRDWKTRDREKCRGGKCRTGKPRTSCAGVENAGQPSMEREKFTYA